MYAIYLLVEAVCKTVSLTLRLNKLVTLKVDYF